MGIYYIAQGALSMFCGDLNGKEIHKIGVMCICIADSLWFTAGISIKL